MVLFYFCIYFGLLFTQRSLKPDGSSKLVLGQALALAVSTWKCTRVAKMGCITPTCSENLGATHPILLLPLPHSKRRTRSGLLSVHMMLLLRLVLACGFKNQKGRALLSLCCGKNTVVFTWNCCSLFVRHDIIEKSGTFPTANIVNPHYLGLVTTSYKP